jgi:hypothetical protein
VVVEVKEVLVVVEVKEVLVVVEVKEGEMKDSIRFTQLFDNLYDFII